MLWRLYPKEMHHILYNKWVAKPGPYWNYNLEDLEKWDLREVLEKFPFVSGGSSLYNMKLAQRALMGKMKRERVKAH